MSTTPAPSPNHTSPARFYLGEVVHTRHQDLSHKLRYTVFSMFLDIDRLPEIDHLSPLLSVNRWNIFGFCEQDHMPEGYTSLRQFVLAALADNGISFGVGQITLLAYPRFLGHAFNPLSVFFCHDHQGTLRAVLYQVRNTFGQWHHYLTEVDPSSDALAHACDKKFYVSPFIHMDCTYHFRVRQPGETASILIRQFDRNGPVLTAAFKGHEKALTTRSLLWFALRYFQGGFKILAGIHWEALKMWRKGAKLQPRPEPPAQLVTRMSADTITYGKEVQ